MDLAYVPLLRVQRDLYRRPRGMDRFRQYLRTMLNDAGDGLDVPPLVAMNPMGKDHVPALLDALLALDADDVGARAAAEAAADLAAEPGAYRVALVVADDAEGGWTNRYATEYSLRFGPGSPKTRGWLSAVLWTGEPPATRAAAEAVKMAAYRAAHVARHGPAVTLRDMLAQEGAVMARAGCGGPTLDAADLAHTRAVLAPLLDARDMRTAVECLFGDAPAATLGFSPRGLRPWAGLALARHDAGPRRPR